MRELSPCFDDRAAEPWPPGGPVPLDRAGLLDLPLADYTRLRPHLRTGDLLFCSGRTLFARATRFATASPWSHVGILFRPATVDRVLVLEAQQAPGVRPVCLSSFLDNYLHTGAPYPGRVLVVRHGALDGVGEAQRHAFYSWMVDELGRPYSLTRTAIIGFRQLVNLIGLRLSYRYRLNGVICSEVVATAYRHLGVHLDYNPRGFITPGDIAATPGLSVLGRLR